MKELRRNRTDLHIHEGEFIAKVSSYSLMREAFHFYCSLSLALPRLLTYLDGLSNHEYCPNANFSFPSSL